MFCGIVEEIGHVVAIEWKQGQGMQIKIQVKHILEDAKIGDSISVNGCCLTVVSMKDKIWISDVVPETVSRTNLKYLEMNSPVNLERAVRYQERIGGHLVQGHVDGIGEIIDKHLLEDGSWLVMIQAPPALIRYMVEKGSVTVDGVSLTLVRVYAAKFSFAMIPHTAEHTILGLKKIGEYVNLEVDMLSKYIERFLSPHLERLGQDKVK